MSGGISQLQIVYDPEQDRLMLRVNTQSQDEFRFWLTRRYTQLLHQALKTQVDSDPDVQTQVTPEAQQAIQSFKREEAKSQGDFKQEFKESTSFPLGVEPLLAYKLSYKNEQGKLQLGIEPKEGQGIKLALDMSLNLNITQLLRAGSEKAGWGLSFDDGHEIPAERVIN